MQQVMSEAIHRRRRRAGAGAVLCALHALHHHATAFSWTGPASAHRYRRRYMYCGRSRGRVREPSCLEAAFDGKDEESTGAAGTTAGAPASASQPYVTPSSNMADLIDRLGLKKVDSAPPPGGISERSSGTREVGDRAGEERSSTGSDDRGGSDSVGDTDRTTRETEVSGFGSTSGRSSGTREIVASDNAQRGSQRGSTKQLKKSNDSNTRKVAERVAELSSILLEERSWEGVVSAGTTQKLVDISNASKRKKKAKSNNDAIVQSELNEGNQAHHSATDDGIEAEETEKSLRRHLDVPVHKSMFILDQTSEVSLQTQLDYARNGHCAIRDLLPSAVIQSLRADIVSHAENCTLDAFRQKVEVASGSSSKAVACSTVDDCVDALKAMGVPSDSLPFLQYFNVFRESDKTVVRKVAKSALLSHLAAVLLDVPAVKLYQDSIFHKRGGDGPTPWHSDAKMAPFDTSKMVTFWIPLQPVPGVENGGTGLHFADGSHMDFALPYWNEVDGPEYDRLEERYCTISNHMPLRIGDVTAHSGWTLHCADDAIDERWAYAVTFVDDKAELREDIHQSNSKGDDEDRWSYKEWTQTVPPRKVFTHPLVPTTWPKLITPKDLAKDPFSMVALNNLRNKDPGAISMLESSGTRIAGTLSVEGLKSKSAGNQDRAVLVFPFSIECEPESPFAGSKRLLVLADGHNTFGETVAQFVCDKLPGFLTQELNNIQKRSDALSKQQMVERAMNTVADSFVEVDSLGQAELNPPSGGCTSTVVLQLGKYAFVANCGDSCSFIATHSRSTGETEIIYVTEADKPQNEEEKERIERAGGSVLFSDDPSEVPRVVGLDDEGGFFGGIATSRSIGDWEFSEDLGIIADPSAVDGIDLSSIVDSDDRQAFAVCMSDGVSDVMQLEEIAGAISKSLFYEDGPHLLNAIQDILEQAKDRWAKETQGTYRDDMTIVASLLDLEAE